MHPLLCDYTPVCIFVVHFTTFKKDDKHKPDVHADIFLLPSYTTKDISQPTESDINLCRTIYIDGLSCVTAGHLCVDDSPLWRLL